jgi:hypothetical protein
MNKQTKLDDFLREKVDADLSFEYREEDWNKATKLIVRLHNIVQRRSKYSKWLNLNSYWCVH